MMLVEDGKFVNKFLWPDGALDSRLVAFREFYEGIDDFSLQLCDEQPLDYHRWNYGDGSRGNFIEIELWSMSRAIFKRL